ncbi:MAG: hypothetical protein PHG91_00125 [Syntrophales bacterium]|nr:hypothetical protein [Syntrophales bacterium]MDD5231774.1 hypothetical protein [Syntrophales bacterium]MDD5532401.1 hypothetical protein [Syntrophales bacterium]HPL63870.1 hypothetical protein [Syntrophales bacterium]
MKGKTYTGETDKRIIEKKIMGGELSEEDLRKYLRDLPDVSEYAEEITSD